MHCIVVKSGFLIQTKVIEQYSSALKVVQKLESVGEILKYYHQNENLKGAVSCSASYFAV